MFIPDPQAKKYSLPVRIVKGRAEYFYGGTLPAISEGTIGDLIVPAHSVLVDTPWDWLDKEFEVEILSEGTVVWLMLHPQTPELAKKTENLLNCYMDGNCRGVRVELTKPLHLLMRGTKQAKLQDCRCYIPSLKKEAQSLNHAYRLASEELEPSRRSHAGNVFQWVFWQGDRLLPLDDLRDKYQANLEQHLVFLKRFYTLFGPIDVKEVEESCLRDDEVPKEFWDQLHHVKVLLLKRVAEDRPVIQEAAREDFSSFSDSIGERLKDGIDYLAEQSLEEAFVTRTVGNMLIAAHNRMFRNLAVEDHVFALILDILNRLLGAAIESEETNRELMYDVRRYVSVALIAPTQRRGAQSGQFSVSQVLNGMGLGVEKVPIVTMALKQRGPLEPGLILMTERTAGFYSWRFNC